jgi:hypothetical protein
VALSAAAIFSASLAIAPSARAGGGICGTLADELTAERAGLELEWMVSLPIDHTQGGIEHVVIDDDLVIVQTGDGGVHAIHTGAVTPDGRCNPQVIWSTHLGSPGQPIVAASAGPELVMVPRGNELYALERSTGQIRWQQHLQQSPIAGGAAVGEWVYQPQGSATVLRLPVNPWRDTGIGSTTVEARAGGAGARASRATAAAAMAARTGKGKPTATLTSAEKRARMDATESLKPLPLNGGGTIERDMLPFGSGVLWSTRDGTIISLQQGDRDWQREEFLLDSPQAGPLATRGASIFATTTARDLARIDSLDAGSELRLAWRVLLDGQPEEDGPFVVGDRIVVSLGEKGLRCYSTETGDLLWANCCPGEILAVMGERIWIRDRTSHLSSIDLATGEPRQVYCFGAFEHLVVNHQTDRLILASPSGMLVCLKAKGAGAPKAWSNLQPLPEPEVKAKPTRPAPQPNPPEHLQGNANAFDDEPAAEPADTDTEADGGFGADPGMDDEPPADDASGEDPFNARDS